jgi:hypothetical protein
MIDEATLLQSAIAEYKSVITPAVRRAVGRGSPDRLIAYLSKKHDWTNDGASAIVRLANDYGAFMLRNALALAVVLIKEDGDLGF